MIRAHLVTALELLAAVGIGWFFGVRYGFVRGMRSRLAGAIPPKVASSRQLTKGFGKGLAKSARAAHKAELAELRKLARGSKWKQLVHRVLFPLALLVATPLTWSCSSDPIAPAVPECTISDTLVSPLDTLRDSATLSVTITVCVPKRGRHTL